MKNFRFRDPSNREWKEIELKEHDRIYITDSEGNEYELKPYKFGGIEILANDGTINIHPSVSNCIRISTTQ